MKIIISSTGPDMDSPVDPRFGRASFFLLVDSETGQLLESISNSTQKQSSQGAGISAAALVADKGAKCILTGVVGPKATSAIEKVGITIVPDVHGTVYEAVALFKAHGSSDSQPDRSVPSSQKTVLSNTQGGGCRREGGTGRGNSRGNNQGRYQRR